jgi:exosortase
MVGWRLLLQIETEWWFCVFVPGIVAYLVYRIRATLATLPVKGTWWGLAPATLSLLFYWIGYKVDTGYLGFASVQLMVMAFILLLGGKAWMRALLFPWAFLLFMWPLIPLEGLIASPLRTLTAQLSSTLLNLIGVPVVRIGTGLHSAPDFAKHLIEGDRFKLDVADPCSGIRSLFALIMLAALYGHLALKRVVPRVLLFLSALPLAVAGNLVRLVLLALGAVWFGQDFAIGKVVGTEQHESAYHELCGYLVFAVALGGMFAISSALEGRHWKRVKWLDARAEEPASVEVSATSWTMLGRALACAALTGAALMVCAATPTTPKLAEPGLVMQLPATLGNYQSIARDMDDKEKQLFAEGVTLVRRFYLNPENRRILATLVMSGPVKKSLHQPMRCLPDQGWTIADSEVVPVKLADGREIEVSLMNVYVDKEVAPGQRARTRALNVYWYQGSHGVGTPSYAMSHTRTYLDSIFRNLNHRWGQVSLFMPISERPLGDEDPLEEIAAREALLDFTSKLAPKILAE